MKKQLFSYLFFTYFTLSSICYGQEYYPSPLLQLDPHFSHHVIIAEKSTHQLHLYRNKDGVPELVSTTSMASGKKAGNKLLQGDYRTPEGIYFMTHFLTHKELIKRHGKKGEIYGVGAFVLDYPNPIDLLEGKTGSGIWLHSTNDETRIDKGLDSRGCLVTANQELIDLAKYFELGKTPLIIVHNLNYLSKNVWTQQREKLKKTLNDWLAAWESENHKNYISFYHQNFQDRKQGGLTNFSNYKKAVFSRKGRPTISAEDTFILQERDYAMITFKQNYHSNTIKDQGRKVLYLMQDEYYNWKIISENWSKRGINDTEQSVAFRPSMRFFETRVPSQILGEALIQNRDMASGAQSSSN